MKIYCIFTVATNAERGLTITWLRHLHLFKEHAFAEAKEIGESACVVELNQANSWNYQQMQAEEF